MSLSVKKKLDIEIYLEKLKEYQKKYGEKVFLLWQCGTFFEVYAHKDESHPTYYHIKKYSDILNCKIANKGNNFKMAGYGVSEPLQRQVPRLNKEGYTVIVWEETGTTSKGSKIRSHTQTFSPGTNFDDPTQKITNNCCTIWLDVCNDFNNTPYLTCGISTVDIITGKSILYEFKYKNNKIHDTTAYDNLERFISIYNPSEVILIHNFEHDFMIEDVIIFANINADKIHKININEDSEWLEIVKNAKMQCYHEELLSKFYKFTDFFSFVESNQLYENIHAFNSFIFLLHFLFEHNPNLTKKLREPIIENNEASLKCANHSLKQLNIINTTDNNKKISSVLSFINKCVTNMGKRDFNDKILHPITDIETLNTEYDMIEFVLKNDFEYFMELRKKLRNVNDIEKLYRKFIANKIQPYELVNFYNNLQLINTIETDCIDPKRVKLLKHTLKIIKSETVSINIDKISKLINFTVDIEKLESCNDMETNFFNKGVFERVDNAHKKYVENWQYLKETQKKFSDLISKSDSKSKGDLIKIHETDKSGISFKCTSRRATFLQNELKKITSIKIKFHSEYDGTLCEKNLDKNITFFPIGKEKSLSNSDLTKLYNDIAISKNNLNDEITQHYNQFIQQFSDYINFIYQISQFVSIFDLIISKAYVSHKYNYCKPSIKDPHEWSEWKGKHENTSAFFSAKGLRHPLIEHINTNETYVSNDMSLGKESNGILLYGTNAVGKSSLIKSIGIAQIMVQAGMYAPASNYEFYPYNAIYTRLLGNDDLFKSLSTFAVEISELRTILNYADNNSLILGDELCSGTEIGSAVSIFKAGISWFEKNKSSFIFATHFHQISDEYKNNPNVLVKHMEVEYNQAEDKLTYHRKLKDGPGNNSYGIEVCKSLNLPDIFIKNCYNNRLEMDKSNKGTLRKKKSTYNSKKIKGSCEFCGEKGIDIHHLTPQQLKDNSGYANGVRVNHAANLTNICKKCHKKFTKENTVHRKTKTSDGYELVEQ